MSNIVTHVTLINYIKKLGANSDHIESFIANITNSEKPQKLVDSANQISQITIIPRGSRRLVGANKLVRP